MVERQPPILVIERFLIDRDDAVLHSPASEQRARIRTMHR
jgi:hypothetical protein